VYCPNARKCFIFKSKCTKNALVSRAPNWDLLTALPRLALSAWQGQESPKDLEALMPEDVKSSQSEYTFRRQLKTWLSFPDIII